MVLDSGVALVRIVVEEQFGQMEASQGQLWTVAEAFTIVYPFL